MRIVERNPRLLLGVVENVVVQSYRTAILAPDLHRVFALAQETLRALPRGSKLVNVTFIASDVRLPSEEVRELSTQLMKKMLPMQHASVVIVEGTGFFAGTARAVMSGMALLARDAAPQKVVADADEAAAYMQPFLGKALAPALSGELRRFRAEHPDSK